MSDNARAGQPTANANMVTKKELAGSKKRREMEEQETWAK
jgi:hypothetical protein